MKKSNKSIGRVYKTLDFLGEFFYWKKLITYNIISLAITRVNLLNIYMCYYFRRNYMSKKEEQQRFKESLLKKKNDLMMELNSIENFISYVQFPDLSGRKVKNKKLGEGIIVTSEGQYFTVVFSAGEKKFSFPDSFTKGFLEIEDASLMQSCNKYQMLLEKKDELNNDMKKLDLQIQGI